MIHPIQHKLHTKLFGKRHFALFKSQNVQILVYPLRGTFRLKSGSDDSKLN